MAPVKQAVTVGGRQLRLSNLGKILWPEDGYTKADLIGYYTQMAPFLLPYLKARPLVLTRYPDGIHGKWFYHKDTPNGTPEWIPTWPYESEEGRTIRFLRAEEPAALAFVANLGAIELHPWLSTCGAPDHPDWAVIDLDPAEGASFADVLTIGRLVRQLLAAVSVQGFPKLSGATGIHIYCPTGSAYTYAETAAFCEAIGRVLLHVYPQKVTLERVVARRQGKVYIDYLQNRRGQTITSVYGLRPQVGAPVSAPVTWEEIEVGPPRFNIRTIIRRVEQVGDLFRPVLEISQDLRQATVQLQQMAPS
jgi:bifunctional non-homologous end joining protein LigD